MKTILLLTVMVLVTTIATAQRARLNAYSSYVFDDKFDSYYDTYNYYNGKIKGGYQWGAGIEYMIQPRYCVELMYLHQSTHAPTTYLGGVGNQVKEENFELNTNYLLIGSDGHAMAPGGKAEGYAGLFLGMNWSDLKKPSSGESASATKFAWGARLGCNIWAGAKVGIKLQAQILSVSQGAGGGFYFGTGGAGVGLSSYSSIYQFGLGGGLTFKIGH